MTVLLRTIIAAGALAVFAANAARAEEILLSAELKGGNEVPGPGATSANGTADIRIETEKFRLCYTIESSGLAEANMAHIHAGAAGASGAPVVTLTIDKNGNGKTCIDVAKEIADAIIANPAGYYVNVHSKDFPAGAIRGQLSAQ